ncbi:hypothetical protein LTR53_014597 [Teratosphaeriaceae sp. CCFEE 6253]|nr:hypothetical protein LTR53_014597 [Teratosphaeriaceae sp. CCFEE 6253]
MCEMSKSAHPEGSLPHKEALQWIYRRGRLPKLPQRVESDATGIALATKSRTLRLYALRIAPNAFASSYEIENQWGLDQTIARLSNPNAAHFVSLRTDSGAFTQATEDLAALLSVEWTGFIALLGPENKGPAQISAKKDPLAHMTSSGLLNGLVRAGPEVIIAHTADSDALDFHIGAVFVDPSARRGGIGMALIDAALSEAESQTRRQGATGFECTIHVDKHNDAAVTLYQKAGFVVLGEETYVQQAAAPETGETRVIERVAYLMEVKRAVSQT